MRLILISLLTGIASQVAAQTLGTEYSRLVKTADSLYRKGDYKNSGSTYSKAFRSAGWKGSVTDRYNAACSWADLEGLRNDPRWKPLIERVKQNKDKEEINFDKKLIRVLDSLVKEDQDKRHRLTAFDNNQLKDNNVLRTSLINAMLETDSLNYGLLREMVKIHGFPNFDLVGERGSHNFWLLIQHQDRNPKFQEEVLSKMKVDLIDRVKVNTGQLQVYGTQMTLNATETSYEPKPVIEPEKLNERRKCWIVFDRRVHGINEQSLFRNFKKEVGIFSQTLDSMVLRSRRQPPRHFHRR